MDQSTTDDPREQPLAEPLIRLSAITKRYGSHCALNGVTLEIGAGITGLLGPNGAGKSTLIKVLLGLVKMGEGEGTVLGMPLRKNTLRIRSAIGYMPEDDCYIAGLSGVELVQFAARMAGKRAVESLRRAHEILDFSGVGQERYRRVDTYSTGMRQKVKFAQAIVHDPPILILDEPTSGLDPEERHAMLNRIQVLSEKAGKAVVLSTHILPDVQACCERVIILAAGRMRLTGSMQRLREPVRPAMQVRLIGPTERFLAFAHAAGAEAELADDGLITIAGPAVETSRNVWHWARESDVGIRVLMPARNSLEQVFVDAVREGARADS